MAFDLISYKTDTHDDPPHLTHGPNLDFLNRLLTISTLAKLPCILHGDESQATRSRHADSLWMRGRGGQPHENMV